jgi:hypothetical protein
MILSGAAAILGVVFGGDYAQVSGQTAVATPLSPTTRIGEKLTYTLSFGKISNAGYAETHVVSRGKMSGKDAVEIRGRVKTVDLVSAAFLLLDETRTVFAAPDTGLPLYLTTSSLDSVSPKPASRNYLQQPTLNFDLVTLLFKARETGGSGTFSVSEGDQIHTVTFQTGAGSERIRTGAGDFDTSVSIVQSNLLLSFGVKECKVNFSTDEARVPVLFRMKTPKGEIRATLAALSMPEPEAATATPSPTTAPTPKPVPNGKPTPAPTPEYIPNAPLVPELGFVLGEVLDFKVSQAGKPVGVVSFSAVERRRIDKVDTLVLTAVVTGVEPGTATLRLGDTVRTLVDPDTLAPFRIEARFQSIFPALNQTALFDPRTGSINFGGKTPAEGPIGTHSLLSLFYAMRSFNLKPSDNKSAPVNDTRVAVFWDGKTHVFTLRPGKPQELTFGTDKVSAQAISITTGSKDLDALSPKVWLRTDDRVPLRISLGPLQLDLIPPAPSAAL